MKINELMEALPGQVSGFRRGLAKIGLGGKAASSEKKFRAMAKTAYDQWIQTVPRIQASGTVDLNNIKNYSQAFGNWMAKNLKLDADDPIISKAKKSMKATDVNKINKEYLITLISSMIGQHRSRALGMGGKIPLKPLTRKTASDGEEYILIKLKTGGLEWHDKDGNRADDAIQRELGLKA